MKLFYELVVGANVLASTEDADEMVRWFAEATKADRAEMGVVVVNTDEVLFGLDVTAYDKQGWQRVR
jgi:hypothetical protein